MKRLSITLATVVVAFAVNAQSIMLQTSKNGIRKSNDRFAGFEATFSYNEIESVAILNAERGAFSAISIAGAFPDGELGSPELPAFKKIIAVPVGATPRIVVKNYSTTEYNLADYDILTIAPAQPSVRKNQQPEDVPFAYNEAVYSTNSFTHESIAEVGVIGTMRGMVLGMIQIRPVSYNPVTHSLLAYNDIEVEVIFENGDYAQTQSLYQNTYSIYFEKPYNTIFNRSIFDDRPDLYNTPVHMLVVADRMFEQTLQPWIEWKTQKGFYLDVNYTDETGSTMAAIKTFCHNKYNEGAAAGAAPTFLIFVGDVQQIPRSGTVSSDNNATDLGYASVDGDMFPEMYYSRMSAQTTVQLQNIIEKILYYEKYQFADPTFLDNTLLIAGWDNYWNPRIGKPTIQYATTYYFNAAHGFSNVYSFLERPYNNPYANINNIGFVNYTAHCDYTLWDEPRFNISNVNALTNSNKYFVAMGNCCLAADFGQNECIGEAFVRAPKKGAVGYIGSAPSSYWYEDFYFAVGAWGNAGNNSFPTPAQSSVGLYDMMFDDAGFNTLSSYVFLGNLAVTHARTTVNQGGMGYEGSVQPLYYWQGYNVLGDGSLMPYLTQGSVNNVSHLPTVPFGLLSYEVTAVPGSYVAISKDGVLLGTAVADAAGVANVTLNSPITSSGNVDIVVTRNQYQPYIAQVPAAAMSGAYVVTSGYTVTGSPALTYTSVNTEIAVTLKNVGVAAANGPLNITFTCDDPQLTIINGTTTSGSITADGTVIVNTRVTVAHDIPDNKTFPVTVLVTATNGTWESRLALNAFAPKFSLEKVLINDAENGILEPGTVATITTIVKNTGNADAYNVTGNLETYSEYITPACDGLPTPRPLPAGETTALSFVMIVSPNMSPVHTANLNLSLFALYGRSFAAPVTITNSASGAYCTPGSTNCSSHNDRFTSVVLVKTSDQSELINHAPTCSSNGYTDYTNMIVSLIPGEQYTIKVKTGYANHRVRGWFDLNGNNIFDTNEKLIELTSATVNTEYTQTFTIPEDVAPGAQRFRLRTRDGSTYPADACTSYTYGQTLDYTVIFPEIYLRVQNVEAVLQDENIDIAWEAPSGDMVPVGYNIYRDGNRLNTTLLTNTTFTEENVSYGIYIYSVTAVYTNNKESFAQTSNVICNLLTCTKPANFTGGNFEMAAILEWEDPEEAEGLLGYNIYRDGIQIEEVSAQTHRYTDFPPMVGVTYSYQVSAIYVDCEALTNPILISVWYGVKEFFAASCSLYPNPASGEVTIKGNGLSRVELFDLRGRKLAGYNNITDILLFNVSNYDNGLYFVKIYSENNQMVTKKLVIAK